MAIGPVVRDVSNSFDLYWNSEWAYPITAFDWATTISEEEIKAFRAQSDTHLEQVRQSKYADIVRQFDMSTIESIEELDFVWVPEKCNINGNITLDQFEPEIIFESSYSTDYYASR